MTEWAVRGSCVCVFTHTHTHKKSSNQYWLCSALFLSSTVIVDRLPYRKLNSFFFFNQSFVGLLTDRWCFVEKEDEKFRVSCVQTAVSGFAFLIPANCTVRHLFFLPLILIFFFFNTCVVVALRRWLLYGKWIIVSFGREDDNFSSVCHEGMGLFSLSYRSDLWGKMGRASKQTQTYLLFFKVCLCLSLVFKVSVPAIWIMLELFAWAKRERKNETCVYVCC